MLGGAGSRVLGCADDNGPSTVVQQTERASKRGVCFKKSVCGAPLGMDVVSLAFNRSPRTFLPTSIFDGSNPVAEQTMYRVLLRAFADWLRGEDTSPNPVDTHETNIVAQHSIRRDLFSSLLSPNNVFSPVGSVCWLTTAPGRRPAPRRVEWECNLALRRWR